MPKFAILNYSQQDLLIFEKFTICKRYVCRMCLISLNNIKINQEYVFYNEHLIY